MEKYNAFSNHRIISYRAGNHDEYITFENVINAYKLYSYYYHEQIDKIRNKISNLPIRQQEMLSCYKNRLIDIEECVESNQDFLNALISKIKITDPEAPGTSSSCPEGITAPVTFMEMTQLNFNNLVREWSQRGASERNASYTPIIESISKFFPPEERSPETVKILVPGGGLGRLSFEIACKGYEVVHNEVSPFPLLMCRLMFHRSTRANMYRIHPWAMHFKGNTALEHQLEQVSIPDVSPRECIDLDKANLSIVPGDFLMNFKEINHWDCVATCFFIDCTPNVVNVIEKIYTLLKPGGVWVNIGPLEYHFADVLEDYSIEPPYSMLLKIIEKIGFSVLTERQGLKTPYTLNTNNMLQKTFHGVFMECRKPLK